MAENVGLYITELIQWFQNTATNRSQPLCIVLSEPVWPSSKALGQYSGTQKDLRSIHFGSPVS